MRYWVVRPRRVWVSAEAPMIATLSGENRGFRSGIGSAQAEATGDDAAQDFAGAALDRQFGGDQGGVAQRLLEPVVVAVGRRVAGWRREQAHLVGQGLLEIGAQILDDRSFDRGSLAGLQHAGDGERHAAQGGEVVDLTPDAFGQALARLLARPADQLDERRKSLDPPVGAAPLIGELVGCLLPG